MANEIRLVGYASGTTLYGVIRKKNGDVWYVVGEVFEAWGTGSRTAADYAIELTDKGGQMYIADFPTAITDADTYIIEAYRQSSDDPADSDSYAGHVEMVWTGTASVEVETVSTTATSLCNYALSKIGGGGIGSNDFRIDSIYDGGQTANHCLRIHPPVRKEVLCRAWWSEATKYADLGAELSNIDKADWEYAFNLPSDYLGRCQQIPESYHRSTKSKHIIQYDHEVVRGMLFTNIYSNTDGDSAYIRYIYNLTETGELSPLLYEAIAVKLAAELSGALLADGGKRRYDLITEYEELVLDVAQGENNMQHGDDECLGEYTAITCRTD